MDINNLHTFVTVADQGSFSLAADKLFLTQPAISKRIGQLESELNCKLFDRIGRSIVLTPAGETLYQRARQILLEVDDVKREISNQQQQVAGSLTIGTSHHIALHRLPPILQQFHDRYPKVVLDISFRESETIYQRVEQGDLEFGIVTLPEQIGDKLYGVTIWDDPLLFVARKDQPLNDGEIFGQLPAILPQQGTYTRQLVEQAMQEKGHVFQTGMSTNNLETILMLVEAGFGWSALPRTMFKDTLRSFDPGISLSRSLGLILHKDRTLSNAGSHLIEMIKSAAGQNPRH